MLQELDAIPVRSAFSRASASASSETSIAGHPRAGVLVGDRERDRARARADVQDARRVDAVEQRQAALDERSRSPDAGSARAGRPPSVRRRKPHSPSTYWSGSPRRAPRDERARGVELAGDSGRSRCM